MATRSKPKTSRWNFEQIEMVTNFSDGAVDYRKLTFEEVTKKLGVDFSKAANGQT
jgi:hypothetical protein